eukprot:TRINITY_DN12579_c0_g1_i1.p1 TRINITY_DN12579_c0_g1~~TRINITY_DN12579_c0_g1_i1.p1  ORF type:complete len:104 (+),score=15.81 TRINITY_DN12579_c0_g1_i1:103-414(+)
MRRSSRIVRVGYGRSRGVSVNVNRFCYGYSTESKGLEDVQKKKDLPKSNQLPSMNTEEMDSYRKMLYYRSKERGMLEADLLLGTFALRYLPTMNQTQLQHMLV